MEGRQLVRYRVFVLTESPSGALSLPEVVRRMPGVNRADIDGCKLRVNYNLLEVRAEQIENVLSGLGLKLADSWLERLKRNWLHYTENNELDHLASSGTPCCNRPPGHGSS